MSDHPSTSEASKVTAHRRRPPLVPSDEEGQKRIGRLGEGGAAGAPFVRESARCFLLLA